jgi:hypothetical protein
MAVSQPPIWNPIITHTLMKDRDVDDLPVWRAPRVWVQWFTELFTLLGQTASLAGNGAASVGLTTQSASIAPTDLGSTSYSAGVYRVSMSAQITQAATVSSSLTVSVAWTSNGAACSYSWPALTGNTTATVGVAPPVVILVDQGTNVSYSTAYASAGPTPMQYALVLKMETLP